MKYLLLLLLTLSLFSCANKGTFYAKDNFNLNNKSVIIIQHSRDPQGVINLIQGELLNLGLEVIIADSDRYRFLRNTALNTSMPRFDNKMELVIEYGKQGRLLSSKPHVGLINLQMIELDSRKLLFSFSWSQIKKSPKQVAKVVGRQLQKINFQYNYR